MKKFRQKLSSNSGPQTKPKGTAPAANARADDIQTTPEGYHADVEKKISELDQMQNELALAVSERDAALELTARAESALKALVQKSETEIKQLSFEVAERSKEMQSINKANIELQRIREQQAQDILVRFEELAKLTMMLNEMRQREAVHLNQLRELKGQALEAGNLADRLRDVERLLLVKDTQLQMLARILAKSCATDKRRVDGGHAQVKTFGAWPRRRESKAKKRLFENRRLLQACGLFDEVWYLEKYQDVREAGMNPVEHYLAHGWREMRDPGPLFSTKAYIERYPDVAAAEINPLLHFIKHGSEEGRSIQSAKEEV